MSDKMQKLKSWTRTSRGRVSMEDGHHSGRERYMPDDVLVISTPEGDRPALVINTRRGLPGG